MSSVTFDPNRAKVDSAYRIEAMKLYEQGQLDIKKSELAWLKSILGTTSDDNEYQIEDGETSSVGEATRSGSDTSVNNDDDNTNDNNGTQVIRKKVIDGSSANNKNMVMCGAGISATCGAVVLGHGLMGTVGVSTGIIGSIGLAVACITAFTVGTKYMAEKPNKEEHDELNDLKSIMESGNLDMANAYIKLQEAKGEVEIIRQEVDSAQEDINQELEAKEEELRKKQARIDELNAKVESGEELTEEEQSELETLTGEVNVLQDEIDAIKDKGADDVKNKQGDIEEKEDDIDESNNIFKSMADVADYAESYDEASKEATKNEKTAQTINAALGFGVAATMNIPILGINPMGRVLQGMAIAGATMSTIGASEQNNFTKDIDEEIGVRKAIQAQAADASEEIEEAETSVADGVTDTDDVINELTDENSDDIPTDETPVVSQPATADDAEDETDIDEDNDEDDKVEEPKDA